MPKTNVCAFDGCSNTKERNPNLSFHRFPRDEETCASWISICKKNPAQLPSSFAENARVCSVHFSPADFLSHGRQGRRVVKAGAVPIAHSEQPSTRLEPSVISNVANRQEVGPIPSTSTGISDHSSHAINESVPTIPFASAITNRPSRQRTRNVPKTEQRLRDTVKNLRQKLRNASRVIERKRKLIAKVARACKLSESVSRLNASQQAFIDMQVRHIDKCEWTEDEKQFALSLYYKSPNAYRELRDNKQFALPCFTLIREWNNCLDLKPGCTGISETLRRKVQTMSNKEKECVLMFDEMTIKPMGQFNSKSDLIEGLQDLGELGRSPELATHAIVFMVRGLSHRWKQPFCYYLSRGSVKSADLAVIIRNVLESVHSTGLKVRHMVCDQGANNRGALKSLGVSSSTPYVMFNERKIWFTFDVPHLFKNFRNNLMKYDFVAGEDRASWGVIRELFELDEKNACRAVPKLTRRHIDPNNLERMSVKRAMQVLSHSVSAAARTASVIGELHHPDGLGTANIIERLNSLFDCLNSYSPADRNPLRRPLSRSQPQVREYLEDCLAWLDTLKLDGRPNPPCFEGIKITICAVLGLWAELDSEGTPFLITSRLNQDPLENLFAVIRNRGGHNDNPSAMVFRKNLQTNMTIYLMKPPSSNCQDDDAELLIPPTHSSTGEPSSSGTSKKTSTAPESSTDIDEPGVADGEVSDITPYIIGSDTLEECSIRYVAGFFALSCYKKFGCDACNIAFTRQDQTLEQTSEVLIYYRAFKNFANHELGSLRAPTDEFHAVFLTAYEAFRPLFFKIWHLDNVSKRLLAHISNAVASSHGDFWTRNDLCQEHRDYVLEYFVRVNTFYYLKWESRRLRDSVKLKRGMQPSGKMNPKLRKFTNQ